jgi:hypothetical protein
MAHDRQTWRELFSAKAAKALVVSLTAFADRRYVLSRVTGAISPLEQDHHFHRGFARRSGDLPRGCATQPKVPPSSGIARDDRDVLIAGTSLQVSGPLKVPAGSDLLTVIQKIRTDSAFKKGLYKLTVDTFEGGSKVSRSIDLRPMTLREAEKTTFPGGTVIFVIEGPL